MMRRRSILGMLGVGLACPACLRSARADGAPGGGGPAWSYGGATGPAKWGELSPAYRVCGLGMEQTPIDLRGAVLADTGDLAIRFAPAPARVVNNGHTIQVNCGTGSRMTVNGTDYDLAQFHFHHPSEHLLAGKGFDLECHFVMRAETGALAVLGVFVVPGAENEALQPIWQAMPGQSGGERALDAAIDPAALLPPERHYFRYAGSLTTPPCSEGVLWTVLRTPIQASPDQIRRFAALFPDNARPVMPVHRRFLLESI